MSCVILFAMKNASFREVVGMVTSFYLFGTYSSTLFFSSFFPLCPICIVVLHHFSADFYVRLLYFCVFFAIIGVDSYIATLRKSR